MGSKASRNLAQDDDNETTTFALDEHERKTLTFVPTSNCVPELETLFHFIEEVGQGATSSVSCAKKLFGDDDTKYAVKRLPRIRKRIKMFRREATVLQKINHPNIVKFDSVYVDGQSFHIVHEYCSGGSVLAHVLEKDSLSEEESRHILKQILEAVKYMHDNRLVHRDLKPDNWMFTDPSHERVALIDFGQARDISKEKRLKHKYWSGSPAYMAPEVFRTRTSDELLAVDMWAIGVSAFVLMTGYLPFYGKDMPKLRKSIIEQSLTFPNEEELSRGAVSFIRSLLSKSIAKRLSAQEALEHDWIVGLGETDDGRISSAEFSALSSCSDDAIEDAGLDQLSSF